MPRAGETIVAGRIPGERIATTVATADSAGITTTETVVDTVVTPLVTGRTYRVRWAMGFGSTVVNDEGTEKIREDSVSGTIMQDFNLVAMIANHSFGGTIEVEYTALATGDKTFVATLIRQGGTGTVKAFGAVTRPRYLYVDYIRG